MQFLPLIILHEHGRYVLAQPDRSEILPTRCKPFNASCSQFCVDCIVWQSMLSMQHCDCNEPGTEGRDLLFRNTGLRAEIVWMDYSDD